MTQSPEKNSVNIEEAVTYIRKMVARFRRRGAKTEYALPDVAKILDITPKRAKSLFYRDGVWAVTTDEVERIVAKYSVHLDLEIALSLEYTDSLIAEKRQLNLGITCDYPSSSRHGYGCESTDWHARSAG